MTRKARLAGVLRARQAQEDAARGAVIRARRDAQIADELVNDQEILLASRDLPDVGTANVVVAALAARQTLAAGLAAAMHLAGQAEERHNEAVTELTNAAIRRRGVEKMVERQAAERRRAELAADQRATDEIAISDAQRVAAREVNQ
jgi:flagellar export protein FliJ